MDGTKRVAVDRVEGGGVVCPGRRGILCSPFINCFSTDQMGHTNTAKAFLCVLASLFFVLFFAKDVTFPKYAERVQEA